MEELHINILRDGTEGSRRLFWSPSLWNACRMTSGVNGVIRNEGNTIYSVEIEFSATITCENPNNSKPTLTLGFGYLNSVVFELLTPDSPSPVLNPWTICKIYCPRCGRLVCKVFLKREGENWTTLLDSLYEGPNLQEYSNTFVI